MGGKLFFAPLKEETLKRALDIGTGTGIWAIEFGIYSLPNRYMPTNPPL